MRKFISIQKTVILNADYQFVGRQGRGTAQGGVARNLSRVTCNATLPSLFADG